MLNKYLDQTTSEILNNLKLYPTMDGLGYNDKKRFKKKNNKLTKIKKEKKC